MISEERREYQRLYRKLNKQKISEYHKEWYKNNRDKQLLMFKENYKKRKPKSLQSTIQRNLKNIKNKCLSKGVPFDISINDIDIPTHCPLLGIKLESGLPRNSPQSPSIDKIIPSLGYVKGNVWVISMRANTIKHNASLQEIEMLYKNLKTKIESGET